MTVNEQRWFRMQMLRVKAGQTNDT